MNPRTSPLSVATPKIHSTNTVTDSEADSEEEETVGSVDRTGFMDNIMGVEELEPAGPVKDNVILVKRSDFIAILFLID